MIKELINNDRRRTYKQDENIQIMNSHSFYTLQTPVQKYDPNYI